MCFHSKIYIPVTWRNGGNEAREKKLKIAPREVMAFGEFSELGAFFKDEGTEKSKRNSSKMQMEE